MAVEKTTARMHQQTFSNKKKRFQFRSRAYRKPAVKLNYHWSWLEYTCTKKKNENTNKQSLCSLLLLLPLIPLPNKIVSYAPFVHIFAEFFSRVCVCVWGGYLWPSPSSEQRTNDWMPFLSFSGLLNYHWVTICRGAHFVCTLIIKNIYINWSCSNFAGLRRRPPPIYFFFVFCSSNPGALWFCNFVLPKKWVYLA